MDYWRGAMASLNSDSNSPRTLSNTLPLDKMLHRESLSLNDMRARIIEVKQPTIIVRTASGSATLQGDHRLDASWRLAWPAAEQGGVASLRVLLEVSRRWSALNGLNKPTML